VEMVGKFLQRTFLFLILKNKKKFFEGTFERVAPLDGL